MPESFTTRVTRHGFNVFPAFFGTGARVTYIAEDWREVRVEVPLSIRTRNYVGTIFGGSIYGAVDPFYMIMLMKNLGPDYEVWDKAASIRFLKPGRTTLRASLRLDEAELTTVRAALDGGARSVDRTYTIRLLTEDGIACAEVEKVVYVRRKHRSARK